MLTNRPSSPVDVVDDADDQATATVEDQESDARLPRTTTDGKRRGLRRRRVRATPDGQLVFYL